MYKIIYLPDPTSSVYEYEQTFETKAEAKKFIAYWEGTMGYLYDVMEVSNVQNTSLSFRELRKSSKKHGL